MNGKTHRLIQFILPLTLGMMLPISSRAQQANDDAGFVAPSTTNQNVETAPVEKPSPYDITGIVAQAFKLRKPLQLVNPLAPSKDGDGRESVSWDPDKPEKPKGIILFGIQW